MRVEIIKDKGFQLLVLMFKRAMMDDKISEDEAEILKTTDMNVTKLYQCVQKAWEDELLDNNERDRINSLIDKILVDAENIAKKDNIITAEEKELLDLIYNMLDNFRKEKLWDDYEE